MTAAKVDTYCLGLKKKSKVPQKRAVVLLFIELNPIVMFYKTELKKVHHNDTTYFNLI